MFAMRTAACARPVMKIGFLASALLGSTALVSVTMPASATCVATGVATYDTCASAAAWALDPNITLSGLGLHDGAVPADIGTTPGTLVILSGGNLVNTAGGFFHTGVALTINAGGAVTVDGTDATGLGGIDTFASLSGSGLLTLSVAGTNGVIFGGNNASTAFSGTVIAPTLDNFLLKTGTGTFTINNMTMAEGELLDGGTGGGLIHSAGTANIKSIAVGTGAGANNTMTMSGGTLNITGTVSGVPCGVNCPALRIGDFGGVGVLNQTGGTIRVGGVNVTASYNLGNQGGTGTHNISGGVLQFGDLTDQADSAGPWGIGRSTTAARNSVGTMNLSGTGLVDVQAGDFINGDRDAAGAGATTLSTVNMTGGTFRVRAGANLYLSAQDNGNAIDSIFNLNGGTLEIGDASLKTGYLGGTGAYQFNLGNGTIKVIGSDLTTSVNGTLTGLTSATGVKIDTNGLNANWNGILSGAGWIVKTGAGTLNLGGVNTYTGGTAFNGGVVLVDAVADLGATTAAMSFNGGTLRFGADDVLLTRSGSTNMAGAGTIDTNGFFSIYFGNITGSGALTKTGAGGITTGGNNNAHTGALNVNAGYFNASFGTGIGDTSAVTVAGGALLQIGDSETIGSLQGAGDTTLFFGGTLTTGGNNLSTTYTGTLSQSGGVHGLTKVGTGTFTVNANLLYTGLTTVNGGVMILNGSMADSLLVGAGARFGGNANIAGNVTNNGTMAPGNSPGTINIAGNYAAGVGAMFDMEVQFNNAGAPVNGTTHDFVSITGNATGTTLINVIPFAPSGSPTATTGNGVELVRVAGATGAGQFALSAPVFQGAYEYTLNYLPTLGPDGYFLQSRLNEMFFAEAAMFSASQTMIGSCFRDEDALVGDGNGHVGRAWGKVTHGNRDTGADTGIEASQDYTCGSGGIDLRTGSDWRFGFSGGYGETSSDVTTLAGIGLLEGDGGVIKLNAGLYHGALFANLSLGYGQSSWTYTGPTSAAVDASLNGMVGGLQVGGLWPMGTDWRFGAIAEVNYDDLNCDDDCLVAGTAAEVANWFWKGTLRVDGSMGDLRPFVALSLGSGDTNTITNGSASITTDTNATMFGAKAGAAFMVGEQTALFLNGGVTEGLDNDINGWDGTGGVKIFW